MFSEGIVSINKTTGSLQTVIDGIVHIHAQCILKDDTMATFMPPLSHEKMTTYWRNLVDGVEAGDRLIFVYLSKLESRGFTAYDEDSTFDGTEWPVLPLSDTSDGLKAHLEVAGVVCLEIPPSETGPFRGLVLKLLVSRFHRRKGIARALLSELEQQALKLGRWNLMLDTTIGTPAEHVYPTLGYQTLGIVREYGFRPSDRSLADEIFYWKDLRGGR